MKEFFFFPQHLACEYCIITVLQTNVQQCISYMRQRRVIICVFFLLFSSPRWPSLFFFFFLWGVLVLLCTAAAKIYPAHVVSVCYSMVGAAPAVGCGISAHRSWGGKKSCRDWEVIEVCVCYFTLTLQWTQTHTHLFPWWVEKMPKDHTAYTETCKWAVSAWVFEVFFFFNRNTHTPTTYALYGFYCLIENMLIF